MIPSFGHYETIVVAFSGGKDSLACVLRLLDLGVSRGQIELWHHDVDGQEGSRLMDWPVTRAYCEAVAAHLRIPLYFSWRVGGFEREMLRNASATAPVAFETPDGLGGVTLMQVGGDGPTHNRNGEPYVRRRFPQTSPDLSVRWCSAVLKIDVAARVFANDPRLNKGTKANPQQFLFVTGERREESAARAKYKEFEPHRSSAQKRIVDQWRAVIDFNEADVWSIIRKHGIVPHPAYQIGFGRVSCATCIFGNDDQWAAIKQLMPSMLERIGKYEEEFGVTIGRDGRNVRVRAQQGRSLSAGADAHQIRVARGEAPLGPIYVDPADWKMPSGAFRETGGPT